MATAIKMECEELSEKYCNQSYELSRCSEGENNSVPLQLLQSSFDSVSHSPLKRTSTNAAEASELSRSQQRRSLPMDYRQLAGMRPKTWLMKSAESKHGVLDLDEKYKSKRHNRLRNRVDSSDAHLHLIATLRTDQENNRKEVTSESVGKPVSEPVKAKELTDSFNRMVFPAVHFKSHDIDESEVTEPVIDEFEVTEPIIQLATSNACSVSKGDDNSAFPKLCSVSWVDCDSVLEAHPVLFDHSYFRKRSSLINEQNLVVTDVRTVDNETACLTDFSMCTVCEIESPAVQESLCSLADLDNSVCLLFSDFNTNSYYNNSTDFVAFDLNRLLDQSIAEASLNASNCSTETAPGADSDFQSVIDEPFSSHGFFTTQQASLQSISSLPQLHWKNRRMHKLETTFLSGYKTMRDKPDSDDIDGIAVISFKSLGQLKKYVSWQCSNTGIRYRNIRSGTLVRNSHVLKKPTNRRSRATCTESAELHWQIERGNIKKLDEVEMMQFGLNLQTVDHKIVDKSIATKRNIRVYSARMGNKRRRGIFNAMNCAKKQMRPSQKYNLRIPLSTDVADVEGERNDEVEISDQLEFVTITAMDAQACSDRVQTNWMEKNYQCYQPGCAYGCICRLFSGRKFSKLVNYSYKPKLRVAESFVKSLNEEISRLGIGFSVRSVDKRETSSTHLSVVPRKASKLKTRQKSPNGLRCHLRKTSECTSSKSARRDTMVSTRMLDVVAANMRSAPASIENRLCSSSVASENLAKDLNEPSVYSSSSACSISSGADQKNSVDESEDWMRTPVPDSAMKTDDFVETDAKNNEKKPIGTCSVERSSPGSQNQQIFRKQMVLFQHNQNCGRPCLLEITSNCNWDSARSSILGRLFAVTADTVDYPPICKFVVDGFRAEIRPRAGQKTSIPPDLRAKLGVSKMYAVRVRITEDSKPEVVLEQPCRSIPRSAGQLEPTVGLACTKDVNLTLGDRTVSGSSDLYAHSRRPENVSGTVF